MNGKLIREARKFTKSKRSIRPIHRASFRAIRAVFALVRAGGARAA